MCSHGHRVPVRYCPHHQVPSQPDGLLLDAILPLGTFPWLRMIPASNGTEGSNQRRWLGVPHHAEVNHRIEMFISVPERASQDLSPDVRLGSFFPLNDK